MAENKNEMMSMDELDHVAGGSFVETEKDLRFLSALGLINASEIPAAVDKNNFDAVNKIVSEAWSKLGINMTGSEVLNDYTVPAGAGTYGNNRAGALGYAKYISGRADIDINRFM